MAGFRRTLSERQLSDPDFFVLSLLSVRDGLSAAEVAAMSPTPASTSAAWRCVRWSTAACSSAASPGRALCAHCGRRDAILHVLAAAKSGGRLVLIDRLGVAEVVALRNLLKRAISPPTPACPSCGQPGLRPPAAGHRRR